MHGLLSSQVCYNFLVGLHRGPAVDFFSPTSSFLVIFLLVSFFQSAIAFHIMHVLSLLVRTTLVYCC